MKPRAGLFVEFDVTREVRGDVAVAGFFKMLDKKLHNLDKSFFFNIYRKLCEHISHLQLLILVQKVSFKRQLLLFDVTRRTRNRIEC